MLLKKIIGRYIGTDKGGITVGNITFSPGCSVECNVNESMYNELLELCAQGIFDLFTYASVEEVNDVINSLDTVASVVETIADTVLDIGIELEAKFDDVKYSDNNLEFYSGEEILKTIPLPLPEAPREIELSKNETHILWRIKPVGKEFVPWNELISLAELSYDDTEIKNEIADLIKRIELLEANK